MSVLIFRLNGVEDDEAADVRRLLDERGLTYHETSGGFLGFGIAGLWLLDASQKTTARALIDRYQEERSARLVAEYVTRWRAGQAETTLQRAIRQPLRTLFYLAGAAAVLYLVLVPFLTLGNQS
ncbi:DUF6164 family protein [Halochromatium salexigens]|uniref:DUF2007 domain-containing protein n=1 Tax=Halochromatium salexigens TaxID=49447 RepID=A0AAJ0UD10_HALSE|nr:DUF6164 family protein [Halochromatium salexigens]MBK5929244.1 hypothetical protein [Halochromatium salexigens]